MSTKTQGLLYYETPSKAELLTAANGILWSYSGAEWSQLGWAPSSSDARLAMAQGVDTVLISDGVGALQIYNGTGFTACGTTSTCPPVGAKILTWHTGRMFASGVATLRDTIFVSNKLGFGDGQWNTATRSFRIGTGDGQAVVALASLHGFTLCALLTNSIWLIATDPVNEPANFQANQDVAALSLGIGCVGRDAHCHYGNDLFFLAQDGVRTVQRMEAAAGQWQLSAPLSQPIQGYIDRINRNAWNLVAAKSYQEFVFFFVPLDVSAVNNAVLVYNARLGRWIGVWTGWNGQALEISRFNGVNRFCFGDDLGRVNVWKDYLSQTDDGTFTDNGAAYPSTVWTRGMFFGDPVNDKSAYTSVLRFSAGNANIRVSWVADLAEARTWSGNPTPSGDILGQDVLPFLLASTKPTKVERGLRGLEAFNEGFLKIESDGGWWALRNVTIGAFVNPLRES